MLSHTTIIFGSFAQDTRRPRLAPWPSWWLDRIRTSDIVASNDPCASETAFKCRFALLVSLFGFFFQRGLADATELVAVLVEIKII